MSATGPQEFQRPVLVVWVRELAVSFRQSELERRCVHGRAWACRTHHRIGNPAGYARRTSRSRALPPPISLTLTGWSGPILTGAGPALKVGAKTLVDILFLRVRRSGLKSAPVRISRRVSMTAFCTSCGGFLDSGSRYCGTCGTPIGHPKIGRFLVRSRLGDGPAGAIYAAVDPLLDREVALRTVSHRLWRSEGDWGRYERSLRALTSLRHPHTVEIYSVEPATDARLDTPIVVMELVTGTQVPDAARAGLTRNGALWLLDGMLSGLTFLHSRGVAHGRVSPTNPLVTPGAVAKLGDAGIASPLGARGILKVADANVLRGAEPSMPGDVFAVGATCWWIICGHTPFPAGSRREALAARGHVPARPPGLPPNLASVLTAAMAPTPGDRPTVAELHAGFRASADVDAPEWRREGAPSAAEAVAAAMLPVSQRRTGGHHPELPTSASESKPTSALRPKGDLFGSLLSGKALIVAAVAMIAFAAFLGILVLVGRGTDVPSPSPSVSQTPTAAP